MPEAWLSDDRRTFHMRKGGWSASYPVGQLDRWLSFYRGLRDRLHGKFSPIYAPTVRALERVQLELRGG